MAIVVYCNMADDEAARFIADTFGYERLYIPKAEVDLNDPRVVGKDAVLVGGWLANPFVAKYFPEYRLSPFYPWGIVGGFGVSPDGRRVTWTKWKNDTWVTTVYGISAEDTLEAAKRFCLEPIPVIAVILPILGLIPATAVWTSRGKRTVSLRFYLKLAEEKRRRY